MHALLGIGSVIAGLAMVLVPQRAGHERRVLAAAALLVVLSAPLLLVGSLAGHSLVVLSLGVAVGPYMIGVFTLGERICPPGRVALGMTLLGARSVSGTPSEPVSRDPSRTRTVTRPPSW